jgi:hypothetical protein
MALHRIAQQAREHMPAGQEDKISYPPFFIGAMNEMKGGEASKDDRK